MQHKMFRHMLRSKKRTRRLMYMDPKLRELVMDSCTIAQC